MTLRKISKTPKPKSTETKQKSKPAEPFAFAAISKLTDRERKTFTILSQEFEYFLPEMNAFIVHDGIEPKRLADRRRDEFDATEFGAKLQSCLDQLQSTYPDYFELILGDDVEGLATRPLAPEERTRIIDYFTMAHSRLTEIRALAAEEIASQFNAISTAETDRAKQRIDKRASEDDMLSLLNDPEAKVDDYAKWLTMAKWTREEALMLSFGKNPNHVTEDCLEDLTFHSPFRKAYAARSDLLRRAIEAELLPIITPSTFFDWCKQSHIDVPDQMMKARHSLPDSAYQKLEKEIAELKARLEADEADEAQFEKMSRRALYTLILVMAVKGFDYNLGINSHASAAIADAFQECGLKRLGESALLKRLNSVVNHDKVEDVVAKIAMKLGLDTKKVGKNRSAKNNNIK